MIHEIKLIKIHRRRIKVLKEQMAARGLQSSATAVMEIEDAEKEIKEIENTLRRRLQHLLEKAALKGISADPSISIEIEDIQEYFEEK